MRTLDPGKRAWLVWLVAASACGVASAGMVSIDEATEYQTIDGFGGFGGLNFQYSGRAQYSDEWGDLIVNDLGLSVHRSFINLSIEPVNDNNDPFNTDLSAFDTTGRFGASLPLLRGLDQVASAAGEEIKFFVSILTPPGWMKDGPFRMDCYDGGSCDCCGGSLRADMYDEFAEYLEAYLKLVQQQTGITAYTLSVQNEPRFAQLYASCVYTPQSMADVVAVVGPRLEAAGLSSVRIMIAEDLQNEMGRFEGASQNHPVASQYLDIFALHSYSDGVNPIPSSEEALGWKRADGFASMAGMPLWQTETSGYTYDIDGAMAVAFGIFSSLKYGKASAWVYYRLGGYTETNSPLTVQGVPTILYYACKQFFRYIRPGAVMVACESDDDGVLTAAFRHRDRKTLTVLALNGTGSPQQITGISGTHVPPTFRLYRTSASENCADLGNVSSSDLIDLPPNSITTLTDTLATFVDPSPSMASFAVVHGSPNPAPQRVALRNGGRGVLPTVSVSENAGWLEVTLSGTGNAIEAVNSVDITGSAGGVHEAVVTVSAAGLPDASYTVRVTVASTPVFAGIRVSGPVAVEPGGVARFDATALDQYGMPMQVPLTNVTWTVSTGGGAIAHGVLTAGDVQGAHTVTASSGGVRGTVGIVVAPLVQMWLTDLEWEYETSGHNSQPTVKDGTNLFGGVIRLDGTVYERGIGTYAPSSVGYELAGRDYTFTKFECDIGMDDNCWSTARDVTAVFEVWNEDGRQYVSDPVNHGSVKMPVTLDIRGWEQLILKVTPTTDDNRTFGDWAGAKLFGFSTPDMTVPTRHASNTASVGVPRVTVSRGSAHGIIVRVNDSGRHLGRVYSLNGTLVAQFSGSGLEVHRLGRAWAASGLYVLEVVTQSAHATRAVAALGRR